ncbi:MAG: hypothetical protein VW297_14160, partial [Paracoccaceae bacterium]
MRCSALCFHAHMQNFYSERNISKIEQICAQIVPQLTAIPVLRVWACDNILSFLGLGEAFGGSEAWDEIDASFGGVDWSS